MIDKLKQYRESLSLEDWAAIREKGKASIAAKALLRDSIAHLIKTSYLDEGHWAMLASKHKLRMPNMNEKATPNLLRKYLRKTGVSVDTWNEHYSGIGKFLASNPLWNAYASAGLVLELKGEQGIN